MIKDPVVIVEKPIYYPPIKVLVPGLQGKKGDKGDKGEQGLQGEKGDKGETGDVAPIYPSPVDIFEQTLKG